MTYSSLPPRLIKWQTAALGVAIGLGVETMIAQPATAADDAQIQRLQEAIQRLESWHQSEMRELRAEISQLKDQQDQTQKLDQPQAQAASKGEPKLIESPGHQFGMTSADGQNSIAILARLHFDAADYANVAPEGGAKGVGPGGQGGPLQSGANARRARLGIGGTFLGDWAYRLIYDFGNSSDSLTPGVSGAVSSGVENAYITYNGFHKPTYAIPIALDLGYMDIPWTLDEATSSNDIMFLERPSSQVVATEFGGGDFRSGFGARANGNRYWASLYLTGPQSGSPHTGANIGSYSLLSRASYQIVENDAASVHLGLNGGHLFNSRANTTTTTSSGISTVDGKTALALGDRPELRVDPTVILNTGNIPAGSGTVAGVEGAMAYGPFFVQSEYFHYWVQQRPGGVNPSDGLANARSPTLNFDGGYVEASYSLGGQRRYVKETGAYSGVIPTHPFALTGDGWGALEIAARYSEINLNDQFTPGGAPHLSGGINGGEQKGIDFGLNWHPNLNVRFMLDYIHTDVSKLYKPTTNGAAPTSLAGAQIDALALRSQFLF